MPKVNLYSLAIPKRGVKKVVLIERNNPDLPFELTYRHLGAAEQIAAFAEGTRRYQRHFEPIPDAEGNVIVESIPPVGDRAVILSESSCQMLAVIETAQVGPVSDRYDFEELAQFSMFDDLFEGFMRIATEVVSGDPAPKAEAQADAP